MSIFTPPKMHQEPYNPSDYKLSTTAIGATNTMMNLQIKNTTLINGQDVDLITEDTLIGFIKNEEKSIDDIQSIKSFGDSDKLLDRVNTHVKNIKKLIKLIDSKV